MGLIISYSAFSNNTAINCRKYYYSVCLKEIRVEDFQDYLDLHQETDDIIIQGYQTIIWFLWADYFINPIQKWKCFNKGKSMLEELINENPENIELRFLRLTIQDNLPFFLGYHQNKTKDRIFVFNQANNIPDKDLSTRIINYLCYNSMAKTDKHD